MGLLTVAMLAAGVCHNLPIPYTVFLVIIGIVLGTLARNEESMSVLILAVPALLISTAFIAVGMWFFLKIDLTLALLFKNSL